MVLTSKPFVKLANGVLLREYVIHLYTYVLYFTPIWKERH